ncbi:MAG: ATP-binding protein [Eggerthellaceae bacterium]|nr:ATP-binding protein [Eggerthellaceae bacterium]
MPRIYPRESYLAKLRPFYDSDIIKVITGIRRCGKSCLLLTVMDELRTRGVQEESIVYLNLDKRSLRHVKTADDLDAEIERRMPESGMRYLFIDEVQNVEGFEPVVNGWREEGDVSIFLTGSNSYLLSGELVTKLTGRYIEFEMFTLDFGEWLDMRDFLGAEPHASRREDLEEYLTFGGFPKALELADGDAKQAYVRDVIAQIIEKDIKRRVKIRNMDVFERVLTYVVNNFGAPINSANIAEHFNNVERLPLRRETVARYLSIMESAKIICKCRRFDMKSRRSLGSQEKYYLSDIGIYRLTLPEALDTQELEALAASLQADEIVVAELAPGDIGVHGLVDQVGGLVVQLHDHQLPDGRQPAETEV